MLFSSITFIYLFLPILLIIYLLFKNNIKISNIILLLFSILFYSFEKPSFFILMFICICITYINAILIEKYHYKIHFILSIIVCILPLIYYKYTNFFINNINNIFHTEYKLLHLILPLGISFYTFQMLSYLIDVYKENIKSEKNILNLSLYICFFPQLIAGPIVQYKEINNQIKNREITIQKFYEGIALFSIGLGKKILIANQLGEICNLNEQTILYGWIYGIAYMLQIYFDFSGYSTMAIGLGKMFGFELPINFNYPFMCKNIKDFWKRWHITLSTFFKEYVYIPLGGSRCKTIRNIINLFIVWFLTGFWHGANWNFICWGLFFFILLLLEKYVFKDKINSKIYQIFSLFAIMISFLLFSANDMIGAINKIKLLFIGAIYNINTLFILKNYFFILLISIIGCTNLPKNLYLKIKDKKVFNIIEPIFIISILILSTAYLIDSSFNPFLYFRF